MSILCIGDIVIVAVNRIEIKEIFDKLQAQNKLLIAAHCCWIAEDLAKNTAGCSKVYVDTSFCPAHLVRKGVELLGTDKVMYGTDYPFGNMECCAEIIEAAFPEDFEMQAKVFYGNAAKILGLAQ